MPQKPARKELGSMVKEQVTGNSLRKREAASQDIDETGLLSESFLRIFSTLKSDLVISKALEEIITTGISDLAMFYFIDGDRMVLKGVRPLSREYLSVGTGVRCKGECLCGLAADSGEAVYSPDIHRDLRCTLKECKDAGLNSFVALPIKGEGDILGVLGFASLTPFDFREKGPQLEAVASLVGTALRNAFLYEEAKQRAEQFERGLEEARRVEEALRESEAKYRLLVEHAPAGIYEVDFVRNKFINVNDVMCEYMGYTREEFLGMSPFDILPDDNRALFAERLRRAACGEKIPEAVEYRIRAKNGRDFWVILNSRIIYSEGRAVGATVVVHDITELKRVAEALKDSEEKYRLLVEHANDGIFIAQNGVIKFPNPKTLEILGYSADELARMPYLDLIHSEDRHIIIDRKIRRRQGEEIPSTYSMRIINSSGEEIWSQVNAVSISWEGGPATLNFVRDITPQRRLEAQFAQAQKMEAVGTLAGGIAHDFNNLLMGIQGNASLMLLDVNPSNPQYRRLKNIEDQVMSGAELTKQLLGFARGGKYEVRPTNINELVEKNTSMFGRTKKEIEIHETYQENVWAVEVDQGQIEQVLLNLFVNAWQAMPSGGELFIETENVILDVRDERPFAVAPGRYVKLSVRDTGVGMDQVTRQRIFEPFFTTKKRGIGTGLGLASVYGIIKNHGGIIDVSSETGRGTTFTIYLPASERDVIREQVAAEELLEGKETILLVDDEEMIVEVGRDMLEKLGYQTLTAGSGREAVELYQDYRERISMVILDMIMPGLGGGETYEMLKELDTNIRVLLSSGYSIDGQASEIMKRGCDGFIQKPFSMKDLSKKIREILSRTKTESHELRPDGSFS